MLTPCPLIQVMSTTPVKIPLPCLLHRLPYHDERIEVRGRREMELATGICGIGSFSIWFDLPPVERV